VLERQASLLEAWANCSSGECRIQLGADTGIGWALLRFYECDLAGHIACQIGMASAANGTQRNEAISRVQFEFRTEPGLIERFALALRTLAHVAEGLAVLEGVA
jgi:hypothetical protein